MVARHFAILLLALLLGTVFAGAAFAMGTPEPMVTIENDDTEPYRVTAYTVDDLDEAGSLNFGVTTEDDDRRLVTYADLVWPQDYRNVTLVDEGVNHRSFVVDPNGTVTEPLEGWTRGDVTVYVIERGEERTHAGSHAVTCSQRGQEHRLSFEDGSGGSRSTLCAGGFGWIFR